MDKIDELEARVKELESLVEKLIKIAQLYPGGKMILKAIGVKP